MSQNTGRKFRAQLEKFVEDAGKPDFLNERGIVTCAGGIRLFTNAYVLVRVLREVLDCKLPIQLWHFGGTEITPIMRHILRQHGVDLVEASSVSGFDKDMVADGWQLKAFSILHSKFSEVLFLDADQVPTRNPEFLFDCVPYQETGAVFWQDIVELSADNPIWDLVDLPAVETRSWESGQILVDKVRHWKALIGTVFLGGQAEIVYRMIYGDKDTFQIAWRALQHEASVVDHKPFIDERVLIQRDFDGAPLFQHRTSAKWTYDAPQYDFEGSVHHEACLGFLDDLKNQWNGRAFFPPQRSQKARAEEHRLALVGELDLEIIGNHAIKIELREANEIGRGRSIERQNWFVREFNGVLEVVIVHGSRVTMLVRQTSEGIWEGEFKKMDGGHVVITEPTLGQQTDPVPGATLVHDLIEASGIDLLAQVDGGNASSELCAALKLFTRIEPGVVDVLESFHTNSPTLSTVIADVLASVNADSNRNPNKDTDVLDIGYVSKRLSKL